MEGGEGEEEEDTLHIYLSMYASKHLCTVCLFDSIYLIIYLDESMDLRT